MGERAIPDSGPTSHPVCLVLSDSVHGAAIVHQLQIRGANVIGVGRAVAAQRALAVDADCVLVPIANATDLHALGELRRDLPASVQVVAMTTADPLRAAALDAGADAAASFADPGEVAAAMFARTRVPGGSAPPTSGPDPTDAARAAALTGTERKLLEVLMAEPHRPLTPRELLDAVWGSAFGAASKVSVTVRRLRNKIELDPSDPRIITTVWGTGYAYRGDEPAATRLPRLEPATSPLPRGEPATRAGSIGPGVGSHAASIGSPRDPQRP